MNKFLFALLALAVSCAHPDQNVGSGENQSTIQMGDWIFELNNGENPIPFNVTFEQNSSKLIVKVHNASETIESEEVEINGDSLFLRMPVFGTELSAKISSDSTLVGIWKNTSKSSDYVMDFIARKADNGRFSIVNEVENTRFDGEWKVTFSPESEDPCPSVGIFKQHGNYVSGTFLSETGDYRFLQGSVQGNEMWLSCFDGSHAFLFRASMNEDETLTGEFWSGHHWYETWQAEKKGDYSLSHPDSLTTFVGEAGPVEINFTDFEGNQISLSDERFDNKVVIVQIMGSWCPNCADESRDYARLYNQYKESGLEIVAIAYERSDDATSAKKRVEEFKNHVGANYSFMFGGKANKKENSKDFEFLSGIMSYPTAIFIDKSRRVRKIHTGYYGPSTGDYYTRYQESTQMFIEKLLRENLSS